MKHLTWFALIILSAWSTPCLTQTDASALIDASIANADVNAKDALYYTCHENDSNVIPAEPPPTPKVPGTQWMIPVYMVNSAYRWSVQLDVLFVEGIPLRRMTGINGQKLAPELATFESEKYDRAVAAIHALSPEQRQQRLIAPDGTKSIFFDAKQLKSSYNCRVTGREKLEKRPSTVIRCKPLRELQSPDASKKMSGEVTLWIDNQKPFFHRTSVVLDHNIGQYGRGTTFTDTWSLIDGVWHETSTELNWVGTDTISKSVDTPQPGVKFNIEQTGQGTEIITFSDFKKFRTESRILTP